MTDNEIDSVLFIAGPDSYTTAMPGMGNVAGHAAGCADPTAAGRRLAAGVADSDPDMPISAVSTVGGNKMHRIPRRSRSAIPHFRPHCRQSTTHCGNPAVGAIAHGDH